MTYFLGAWCVVSCYISPLWLTMIYLCLSGMIYQYDFSMDEGTAGFLGIFLLVLWAAMVLVPAVIFLKRMYLTGRKQVWMALGLGALIVCVRLAMCRWDMVAFLTTPGGY